MPCSGSLVEGRATRSSSICSSRSRTRGRRATARSTPSSRSCAEAGLIRERRRAARGGRVYELTGAGLEERAPLVARDRALAANVRDESALAALFLAARAHGGGGIPPRRGGARAGHPGGAGGDRLGEDPGDAEDAAYRIVALELGPQRPRPGRVGGVGRARGSRLVAMSAIEELSQEEVEEPWKRAPSGGSAVTPRAPRTWCRSSTRTRTAAPTSRPSRAARPG